MNKILLVFILLSLVSLTADVVYEGARSIGGSYLQHLNAPAYAAALASIGDFIGYATRFLSGLLSSYYGSSNLLWSLTITGYLAVLTLPFLAFTTSWSLATAIYLFERIGKGLRTPARDTILAEVTEDIGRGRAFGLHELADQVGALTGPLVVALCIAVSGYGLAYSVLFTPAIASIVLVVMARNLYPRLKSIRTTRGEAGLSKLSKLYWVYTLSMVFLSLGYIHWFIISYYVKKWSVFVDYEIALAYTLAMGVDAALALPVGYLYDKYRLKSLYIAPLTALLIPIILPASLNNKYYAYLIALLWGIVMALYEVNMRVAVADLVESPSRPLAYGVYGLIYGVSWATGGFIVSYLLDQSIYLTTIYIISIELASLLTLYYLNTLISRKRA